MRAKREIMPRGWTLDRASPSALGLTVGLALSALYLALYPQAPDLAAQVARAHAIQYGGISSWWTGWFGGLSLPSYSFFVPALMAVVGAPATGVLAVIGGTAGAARLARGTLRPRATAISFAIAAAADVANGRITFTVGVSVGVWALVSLRARHAALSGLLSVAVYAASPLAGFFLGLILLASALGDRTRRKSALLSAGAVLAVAAAAALFFPGTGTMPYSLLRSWPAILSCLSILALGRIREVRLTAGLLLAAMGVLAFVPSAVGDNVTRLVWACAVPAAVACVPAGRRTMSLLVIALLLWPASDLSSQLNSAGDPSARAGYYTAVVQEIQTERDLAGPAAVGARTEAIDTANHWASTYLAPLGLARGWDRQADYANNELFYQPGLLTASSYRTWLSQLAVRWIAVPNSRLDYASVAEARLVRSGLPYLRLTWSDADWRLYEVLDPSPLATGAQVDAVDTGTITLTVHAGTVATVRTRWSPYLVTVRPVTHERIRTCMSDADGWVRLSPVQSGTIELTSQFSPTARWAGGGDAGCG
ncbi:MAG: hypothetical protein JWO63_1589 [Frankiales bacterium]|nr:hypothetical protein [Frankiales bacterium]